MWGEGAFRVALHRQSTAEWRGVIATAITADTFHKRDVTRGRERETRRFVTRDSNFWYWPIHLNSANDVTKTTTARKKKKKENSRRMLYSICCYIGCVLSSQRTLPICALAIHLEINPHHRIRWYPKYLFFRYTVSFHLIFFYSLKSRKTSLQSVYSKIKRENMRLNARRWKIAFTKFRNNPSESRGRELPTSK